ncbi:hypothetical protein BDZ91DRAFT_714325 [Kalaharituber pfeilii]|nr:hypothetical protein BDZ91DRAFT_714325 [Kalaharituber pfeilii]
MADFNLFHPSKFKPSTYSATISTDQIIIPRQEYNAFLESQYRLTQANQTITQLKEEVAMLKEVMGRVMGFYGPSAATPSNALQVDAPPSVTKPSKLKEREKSHRRDSGVDGVGVDEESYESDSHQLNGNAGKNKSTITKSNLSNNMTKKEPISLIHQRNTHEPANEPNLLDLDDDDVSVASHKGSDRVKNDTGTGYDTEDSAKTFQRISRTSPQRPAEIKQAVALPELFPVPSPQQESHTLPPPPSSTSPAVKNTSRRTTLEAELDLGYESPVEEPERVPTPASWDAPPPQPKVDFELDMDAWKQNEDWDPNPEAKVPEEISFEESSQPQPTFAQIVRPTPIQSPISSSPLSPEAKSEPSTPSLGTASGGAKTAMQLYREKLEKKRALAESQDSGSSASSSFGGDRSTESDPGSYRHIYIPNLPSNSTLSTLTSLIRTNGKGGIEFISLFRQKNESLESNTFDGPGSGENIGVNITFTTAEACDVWFKFLFENSSTKLQGNPVKTWLFPNEDSASEWKKCAVFRRADYHPSIAGKIDKGGPGGPAVLQDAQKKGATRVLICTGLPYDVTETELARLSLPPGNRSLPYDGPTHLASGQAGLSTEEFARWKWIEKIVLEDEVVRFDDREELRKTAKIYAACIKTAFLARSKIWKKYNRNGSLPTGKTSGGYVKVDFLRDECEGPLEELPPWVVVGGDDDSEVDADA